MPEKETADRRYQQRIAKIVVNAEHVYVVHMVNRLSVHTSRCKFKFWNLRRIK